MLNPGMAIRLKVETPLMWLGKAATWRLAAIFRIMPVAMFGSSQDPHPVLHR